MLSRHFGPSEKMQSRSRKANIGTSESRNATLVQPVLVGRQQLEEVRAPA